MIQMIQRKLNNRQCLTWSSSRSISHSDLQCAVTLQPGGAAIQLEACLVGEK